MAIAMTYAHWMQNTKRFFATGRSGELSAVDRAFSTYDGTKSRRDLLALKDALDIFVSVKGVTGWRIDSIRDSQGTVSSLTNQVYRELGMRRHFPDLPALLVSNVLAELNRCKTFACTDVGTFSDDINDQLPGPARQAIYDRGIEHGRATGIPLIRARNGHWDPESLYTAYARVYGANAGECTSFANAAAHVLSTHVLPWMPRIEILSFRHHRRVPRLQLNRETGKYEPLYKRDANGNLTNDQAMEYQYVTHVFVVVGRQGPEIDAGDVMPAAQTWGTDAVIVDCWLGALGYPCAFWIARYPKPGYLATGRVFKEMDSYLGPNAVFGTA
ncbi:MAG TPA: hypothetical protein VGF58_11690 [Burkholderiales bacterium]